MLSRTVEYAVRAVIVLARHHGERLVSADEIASILGAPRNYLSKTLNTLTHRGILTSTRGPGGGYGLAIAPGELSVADIAGVFADARPDVARCLLSDSACDAKHPCSAHERWTYITLNAREPLLHTAIAELCGSQRPQLKTRRVAARP
jgi:Rrf2 family protein